MEVEGLDFSYERERPVLRDVSFKVESGEFFGILGPNGSGKTTLVRCLERTVEIPASKVFIDGKDAVSIPRRDLARTIATVSQDISFAFEYTVEEVVSMGRYPHMKRIGFSGPEHVEITRDVMKKTRVWKMKDKVLNHLSGGEKQRVMISRALVQEPKVLILDEPTKNLDIHYSLELMDMIKEMNRKDRVTVVGVFHDLDLAARYSDRLLMLKGGKVHASGKAERVLTENNISKVYGVEVKVNKGKHLHVEVLGRS
jgi:iron complex transport system ATP-binding protein